ncbi:pentapeptide repeat-containing protein [Nostoc sp. UIC 10607]|uniref:nSTAND1 domain-containing NTPase n=1 Tax=Nostoc sp. UIC 10607 TaxID=3045935 RepID=UPI0039A39A3F
MIRDALVVGINTYSYERLPSLTAPAIDAEAIAKLLERYGQFNVKRLPSVKDKENNTVRVGQKTSVTLTQLEEAIVQLFKPEGKNAPDTALLYFSGHGLRKSRGIQQGFLATSDANPDLGNWGLSLQWLRQLLQDSEVKQQIIWLDCCYSGELLNFAEADPGDRGKGRDRCFIAASREFEVAYEAIGSNHSVLTEALLQGLDPQHSPGVSVTNYTLIDFLHHHWANYPQRPIFANSGSAIDLTCTWALQKEQSAYVVTGSVCPYRGLQYFDCKEEDAQYFFGREALTDKLLEKVRSSNFLAILGASGSGKSSVVRAGLLYQIQLGQRLSGSDNWPIKIFRPGEYPIQSLALTFLDSGLSAIDRASQLATAEELLAKGGVGLRQLINATGTERIVLVADQFEEVFTLCQDVKERQRFFECLLSALPHTNNKLCLVLTMRADFFGKCAEQQYSGLAQRIQEHLVTVTPMEREELERAITAPAKKVGLQVQSELVQQIIADVEGSPGSLPLLQYTLTELWQQRTGETLTREAYFDLGGVSKTLQKRATKVYESLSLEEQQATKHIFLELTHFGEGTEDTRRQVYKKKLITDKYSEDIINRVIQCLTNEKLIVSSILNDKESELNKIEVIDVIHETLIRNWEKLRIWINDNKKDIIEKRKIEAALEIDEKVREKAESIRLVQALLNRSVLWQESGMTDEYLLAGQLLIEAEYLLDRDFDKYGLNDMCVEFINKSIEYNKKLQKARKIKLYQDNNKFYISIAFNILLIFGFLNYYNSFINKNKQLEQTIRSIEILIKNTSENTNTKKSVVIVEELEKLIKINISFMGYNLSKANLKKANLRGANFSKANLKKANLRGADLSEANLTNTNLSGADLSGANLTNTNLSGADLSGANLTNTNLKDAEFTTPPKCDQDTTLTDDPEDYIHFPGCIRY